MTRLALAAALALALAGCATAPSTYGPATAGGAGYAEQRIESDRFRVSYQGTRGDKPDRVEQFALVRAAELTSQNGFEWFTITSRRTDGGGLSGDRTRGSVAIGGGSGGGVGVGLGIGIGLGGGGSAPETSLEIRMGRGVRPNGAYDAREVLANLRTAT